MINQPFQRRHSVVSHAQPGWDSLKPCDESTFGSSGIPSHLSTNEPVAVQHHRRGWRNSREGRELLSARLLCWRAYRISQRTRTVVGLAGIGRGLAFAGISLLLYPSVILGIVFALLYLFFLVLTRELRQWERRCRDAYERSRCEIY